MEIIKKSENTWIIEDDGVRCFLLKGNEKVALIDTGMHIEDFKKIINEFSNLEPIVLNTHADRDHIGGNSQFDTVYMGTHEMAHFKQSKIPNKIICLYENDVIDLGNRKLEVINIPGHTPGSIGFYDIDNKTLISGDPIQRNGNVFMFGPQRNLEAYVSSLDRLNKRKDDFEQIWPSHSDLPLGNDSIEKCRDDVKDLIDGKLDYDLVDKFGTTIRAYKGKENIYLVDNDD